MKIELTATRLLLALKNADMIPQELSDKSEVSKSSISQYINGSHAPSNASSKKMGKVLNVNPLWLMGFDVSMNVDVSIEKIIKEYRTEHDMSMEYSSDTVEFSRNPTSKGGDRMSDLGNKEIMAKNISQYMKINGVTQTELCNALGLKMSTFSDWIHARTYPRIDKIELMANYFGVSKSDLVEGHSEAPNIDNHYYLNDYTMDMAQFMFDNPEYIVLFDASRNIKKEDIGLVKQLMDRFRD